MTKDLIIITGASKGLGREIALKCARHNAKLLLIARDLDLLNSLKADCEIKGAEVEVLAMDLSTSDYQKNFSNVLMDFFPIDIKNFYLFNNASTIEPIAELINTDSKSQANLLNLNLNAPLWLSTECLRLVRNINPIESYIINISSGVSLKAIHGWGLYCISKAAVNMVSACIAEETQNFQNPVYSVAINPGALNTGMQESIRKSDETQSPIASKFKEMYDSGNLKNPAEVAKKLLGLLKQRPFPSGQMVDFNNL